MRYIVAIVAIALAGVSLSAQEPAPDPEPVPITAPVMTDSRPITIDVPSDPRVGQLWNEAQLVRRELNTLKQLLQAWLNAFPAPPLPTEAAPATEPDEDAVEPGEPDPDGVG